MRKIIFWIGFAIFLLAVMCFFLSSSTSGTSPETAKPTVPFLYGTNQALWMFCALVGIIVVIVGLVLKSKK